MDTELERLHGELSVAYTTFFQVINQLEADKRSQFGVSGTWSPKDVIAHLIGWDKSLQAFIADPEGFNPDPLYDITIFNGRSVSDRQRQSWKETMDELQSSYTALAEAVTTVKAEMKIYDRVSAWLKGRRKDYEFHTRQMEVWIEQNREASK